MAKKNQYYVVWKGRKKGIFPSWDECKEQTFGYTGAVYKGFPDLESAKAAFSNSSHKYIGTNSSNSKQKTLSNSSSKPIQNSISVDAACSGNPGIMEYQGVYTKDGRQLFHQKYDLGTNNIGEFLAIVHCLAYQQKNNINLPIYTDSKIAMKWVIDKKCKTKLDLSENILHELISRAEKWLLTNSWSQSILKWDTKNWGEIPADFGRK